MYGKRNVARLQERIEAKRAEFKRRGVVIETPSPSENGFSPSATRLKRRAGKRRAATAEASVDGDNDDETDGEGAMTSGSGQGLKGKRRASLQSSTVEAAGGRGIRSPGSIPRRSRGPRRGSRNLAEDGDDVGSGGGGDQYELGASSGEVPHQATTNDDRRPQDSLNFHDRLLLVQLLAQCGPNPSPSDWVIFGEMVSYLIHCLCSLHLEFSLPNPVPASLFLPTLSIHNIPLRNGYG